MRLTPIEEITYKILARHHQDFESILGKTLDYDELEDMLLSEGFSKEAVRRYIESQKEARIIIGRGYFTGGLLT